VQIEYTGRHTEVTAAIRTLAEKKLAKLARVLPGITRVHVILAEDKYRKVAELTVHSPHLDLAAAEESDDFATSLSTVTEKLTRQAQKRLGKLRQRKGGSTVRQAAVWAGIVSPLPGNGDEKAGVAPRARVVQSRRFVAKPMTVDEAVLQVDASDDGLLVFRDSDTSRLSVLYRRKDGNLGLIEPEA
jgi:putative sigma-54 modulation protein